MTKKKLIGEDLQVHKLMKKMDPRILEGMKENYKDNPLFLMAISQIEQELKDIDKEIE